MFYVKLHRSQVHIEGLLGIDPDVVIGSYFFIDK
jgi:hypothetical protein